MPAYAFRTLDAPYGTTVPRDINNHGHVVGSSGNSGFLYRAGAFTQLDVPPPLQPLGPSAPPNVTVAGGINDSGVN
jgi:hypothetical protein